MGNFIIKNQWENQEQDARMSSEETDLSNMRREDTSEDREVWRCRLREARAQKGL